MRRLCDRARRVFILYPIIIPRTGEKRIYLRSRGEKNKIAVREVFFRSGKTDEIKIWRSEVRGGRCIVSDGVRIVNILGVI